MNKNRGKNRNNKDEKSLEVENAKKDITLDRLRSFLGKSEKITNNLEIYSPTVNEIAEIGEMNYKVKLILATFNKKSAVKLVNTVHQEQGIPFDVKYEALLQNPKDYEVLTLSLDLGKDIADALSFFVRDNVSFDERTLSFYINDKLLINNENYQSVSLKIKELNLLLNEEKELKFKNERARKMYERMQELKEKHGKKDDGLDLKDILSILCYGEGNGLNIFNVGDLTVYQVYEQFERLCVKEDHEKMLMLWANTFSLKENSQIDDWKKKTRL